MNQSTEYEYDSRCSSQGMQRWDCGYYFLLFFERSKSNSLSGLSVAQIRVIFSLPKHLGYHPHPLAYIHRFRPLNTIDSSTGMYIVSRSTRNLRPNSAVVSVDNIVGGCHLLPRFSQHPANSTWLSCSIIDNDLTYFFNDFINMYVFDYLH